jgi:beta-lactamase regulating signal transducer with metallopeptidase domain
MNDHVLSFLNAVGAEAGLAALWITLQAAVLVGVLLVVDRLLRHRIRAALRHGLWMLVLLKFVLPPGLLSPTSLAFWIAPRFAEPIRVVSFTGRPTVGPFAASSTEIPVGALTAGFTPAPVSLQLPGILALVWLTGIGVWTTAVLVRNRRIQALVRESEPAPETLVRLLEEAAERLHIDRLPSIRLTRTAHSPALFGFFRPVILLPRELPDRIGPEALRQVLRHELVHLARRDLWFHGFQVAVQALWWWNPLVGLVNARIRALREEAVDEAVMLEPDSESYPSTLVAVARHCATPSGLSLALLSILESRSRLEQRVRRLVEQPLPRSARMGWTGWIAVVLAGALFVPMGFARRVESRRANISTEPTSVNGTDLGLDSAEPVDWRALGQDLKPQVLVNGISPISRSGSGAAFNKEYTALLELRKRYKDSHPKVREQLRKTYQLWRESAGEASESSETDDDLMQKASEWFEGHESMFRRHEGQGLKRATQDVLDAIDPALLAQMVLKMQQALLEMQQAQIELATKWIDVLPDHLSEFARVGAESGSTSILTAEKTRNLLVGIESAGGTEILTAPRVTTLSGRDAEVSVQEAKTVVTSKSPASDGVPETIQSTSLLTGPKIRLTAWVDGFNTNAIKLHAAAEVVEFLGYLDNPEKTPLPLIRTNQATARAHIWDGQSVVLSLGLVTNKVSTKDSVPVLGDLPLVGRLFRKEASHTEVRHRLVLITPTLIDAARRYLNDPKNLPFDPATFPPEK